MPATIPVTPEVLILAYRQGVFPMARSRRGAVDWFSPDPRAILPLDQFHVPHSVGRRYRSGRFRITRNVAFPEVIGACGQPRRYEKETWINSAIIDAYAGLHRMGIAHSVEAWLGSDVKSRIASRRAGSGSRRARPTATKPDAVREAGPEGAELVGGLYGVALGSAFFGESMFSRVTDASKVCLVHLVEHLKAQGFTLLDVQCNSPHMARFGTIDVPRSDFLKMLSAALERSAKW